MTIGIYKLQFEDGSFYIGRSINIESKHKDHSSMLKRNVSGCRKLQLKYNTLKSLPTLSILELCDINNLKDREVYWISKLDAVNSGLNILPGGEDVQVGEAHHSSKYSNSQIVEVIKLLGVDYTSEITHEKISEITGVSISIIKDVIQGRAHTWAKEEYPSIYEAMLNNKSIRKSNSLKNLNPFANKKTIVYPEIISPDKIVYQVEHLTNFCKEHGLTPSNLSKVFKGERAHHKGWRLNASNN